LHVKRLLSSQSFTVYVYFVHIYVDVVHYRLICGRCPL
jgi:hypothetical protein